MMKSVLVNVMIMFLVCVIFGSLAQSGRPQQVDAGSFIPTTANTTSFDEGKMHIILCATGKCKYFSPDFQDCYCCPDGSRKEFCHLTMEDCQANCHACIPACPPKLPVQSAMEGRPLDAILNATSYK
ncbi:hypothetical protein EJB05_04928 [Eragrostis curvula]|uniref:Embryo surrounding factor 1 brassicaceae domain-containing protein n=1 Tax=Eragrostis curvula TaxID=38414 RepID=A0A5J9WBS8_9POAL|nr:hypothetical protein EJB05_04928 [Eragrostis curvula]